MNQNISIHKINAQGNDFLLHCSEKPIQIANNILCNLAHRHFGIGCDQWLLLEIQKHSSTAKLRIINRDGSQAYQCLNGLYACACFLASQHPGERWKISIKRHVFTSSSNNHTTQINIPKSIIQSGPIKTYWKTPETRIGNLWDVGNEHIIFPCENSQTFPLQNIGQFSLQENHCPQGINISCYQHLEHSHISVRTYERGCGLTYSCGSAGLCVALQHWRDCKNQAPIHIHHPGGVATYNQEDQGYRMQGQYDYIGNIQVNINARKCLERLPALPPA